MKRKTWVTQPGAQTATPDKALTLEKFSKDL